jgi:Acetyl-CoA dehydrogenase C-terminal like/Acyl-CoA dehydrogenase, C-terminal domain
VPIIEHADIKRMLLAQKSYVEGALALVLYCGKLVDDEQSLEDQDARTKAHLLLDVLTPITKSWPSQWCLEANSLAIQIHGGYGYAREYDVEQHYRDNRLNPIHEGTHGIQALDLLGRKVVMNGGRGLQLLAGRINQTIERARALPELAEHASALAGALKHVGSATQAAWASGRPEEALANATPYLQAFGHTVLAWVWLDVALCAQARLGQAQAEGGADAALLQGKLAACRYFFRYELPRIGAWLGVVETRDDTCRNMEEAWF